MLMSEGWDSKMVHLFRMCSTVTSLQCLVIHEILTAYLLLGDKVRATYGRQWLQRTRYVVKGREDPGADTGLWEGPQPTVNAATVNAAVDPESPELTRRWLRWRGCCTEQRKGGWAAVLFGGRTCGWSVEAGLSGPWFCFLHVDVS